MDELPENQGVTLDLTGYDVYTPSDNPEGLIRELTIPAEMVVDMSRPGILTPKPSRSESAVRILSVLCWALLIGAAASLLQAMPKTHSSFWFFLTDAVDTGAHTRDVPLLHISLMLCIIDVCVCAAGLLLLRRSKRITATRLVLFSATALLSVLLILYTVHIL